MPDAAVNSPAVVDDGGVAAHGQRPGKDDCAACGSADLQTFAAAEIQAAVEGKEFLFRALADIRAAVAIARGEAVREDGWVSEEPLPEFLRAGRGRQVGDFLQLRVADGR